MPSSNTLFLLLSALVFILSSQVSSLHAKEETNNVEEPKPDRGVTIGYGTVQPGGPSPSSVYPRGVPRRNRGMYRRPPGYNIPRGRSPPPVYCGVGGNCRGPSPTSAHSRGPSPPSVYYGGGGYGGECRYGCCHYSRSENPRQYGCSRCCANAHEAHNVKH